MIDSLTQEQQDKFPLYVEKWLKIGLSTKPIDVEKSMYWITRAYKQAGLEPLTEWVVCDSPLDLVLKSNQETRDQVLNQVFRVYDQVKNQVRGRVSQQVIQQVKNQVRDRVHEQVVEQIWLQVRDQVREQVCKQVWTQVCWGNQDAEWLSQYDFFLNELKLQCVKPLMPLIHLTKHCGWWIPYTNTCFISHKPTSK